MLTSLLLTVALLANTPTHERQEVFTTETTEDIPYRIPAIAATKDGTLICVADYRHSRMDIGVAKDGRIDLHVRLSRDNGKTWEDVQTLIEGQGKGSPDFMNVGYGDPCIVADRKSDRVMVLSCAGNVAYVNGTRDCHQSIARFYSNDGGSSWSEPADISESIYSLFDNSSYGPARSMFIASGRILQSRHVKVGKYHRLYCAVLQIAGNGNWMNFVLYSDNFGKSWNVLGGTDTAPILNGADEAKVEELPGGSILISSRTNKTGRNFNIFTFSDVKRGEGQWGEMAHSSSHNNGVYSENNACNGELMVVPVIRKSDGRQMHLLLQSLPLGPQRKRVGIYYKEIDGPEDVSSPARIAENWEGVYEATGLDSAYSTMAWQSDDKIGFLFEECTHCSVAGGGYTIIYDSYTIGQITGGKYAYSSSVSYSTSLSLHLCPQHGQ